MCPLPVPHLLSAIVRIQWVGVYEGTFEKQKVLVKQDVCSYKNPFWVFRQLGDMEVRFRQLGSVGGVIGLLVDSVELGPSWGMWMPEDARFNLDSELDRSQRQDTHC